MDPLKILIVEDEPLFREMLRHILGAEPGPDVVGVATDGESAVAMAAEKNPDAVIMDIELPGEMDGIDAALKIKERRLDTGIVMLSVHKDRRYVSSLPLSETPGWTYLLKQNVPDMASVLRAIQGSVDGMVVLDPEVVESLQPNRGSPEARLTPRHRQVLELIAQGFNNTTIAQRLTMTKSRLKPISMPSIKFCRFLAKRAFIPG